MWVQFPPDTPFKTALKNKAVFFFSGNKKLKIPFSSKVYVFKGKPFEIVEKPKLLKSKNHEVIDCCIDKINYDRGTGYNEVTDTKHNIVQENYLGRKYRVHRYCIKAIEDFLVVQIKWDGSDIVNGFMLEHLNLSYEPMYFLRHEPEKIRIDTTRYAKTMHKIEVNDRCSE